MLLDCVDELGNQCVGLLFLARFVFLLVGTLLLGLLLLLVLFALLGPFVFSAAFALFLAPRLQSVVYAQLLEVVVGEEQREVPFAVAFHAEDVFVLILR